jgi:hypothetical protein
VKTGHRCLPLLLECHACNTCLLLPSLQRLDRACSAVTETSIVLQLLAVLWRLLGQLVAVESLVFVLLRPKLLQRLHRLLAAKAVSLSAALHRLGLISSPLLPGEPGFLPTTHPIRLSKRTHPAPGCSPGTSCPGRKKFR